MGNTAANAIVGKPAVSGGILIANVGSTLPTDETTAPDVAFTATGYLTDAGYVKQESPNTKTVKAWGGDTLAVIDTGTDYTAKFGFAEYLNALAQRAIYGDANVTTTAATSTSGNKLAIVGKQSASPHKSWIIEIFSGTAKGRIVLPDAQITARDDVTFSDADISARGVTLTLFTDASGNYFYEYWDDGRLAA